MRVPTAAVLSFVASAAMAQDIPVSDDAALQAALAAAKGGEVFVLADGEYAKIALTRQFDRAITLRAATPLGATVERVEMANNARGLQLHALRIPGGVHAFNAADLTLVDNQIRSTLYTREVDGLTVRGNQILDGKFGFIMNDVRDFTVTNNLLRGASEDLMRITGNSHGGHLEGNMLVDVVSQPPIHPDLLQMFGREGHTPHDIVIRRNMFYDDPTTGADRSPQGIFVSDPQPGGYRNLTIEENLISVPSPNSIYINGGTESVVVRNNTLIPTRNDGGAVIRLASKSGMGNAGTTVEGNVAKMIMDETEDSDLGDNYFYGRGARVSALFSGAGGQWQDYVPVSGSEIDFGRGYGATAFLEDLLEGLRKRQAN